jgi:hypothetical protein
MIKKYPQKSPRKPTHPWLKAPQEHLYEPLDIERNRERIREIKDDPDGAAEFGTEGARYHVVPGVRRISEFAEI